jgi:hypothetical protein
MTTVADQVDETLEDLSLAIQDVEVVENFSNVHLKEVRIASIYLSAAIMECLTSLIRWVTRSGCSLLYSPYSSASKIIHKTRLRPEIDHRT